jgi:CPA2 family monovalent cation:H+ antiporter-2
VHPPTFVTDLALVLCVAAATSLGFRLLRQPPILGYLLAGLLVGPHTPFPLFVDSERVHALSEFGVVLVMFCVGLEFSIARLFAVLPIAGLTALVQMSTLGWAGHALGNLFGWSTTESLFLAAALAISSTMVVARVFDERPPEARLRELVFGVLVVQDLVAIALLAVLSAIAAGSGVSAEMLERTLLELGGFLLALLIGGLLVVPRLVRWVEREGSPETVVVVAGALCFGLAMLAARFGYSVALGAFFAGMLAAESGRGQSIEHRVTPLRDLFVAVFFVSVGMTVNPALVWIHLDLTLAVLAVVIIGQLLSVTAAGLLSGNGLRRSVEAGLALGQIGEFAFIMAGIGTVAGIVGEFFTPVLVAVATITSFTTPMLVRAGPRLAAAIDHRLPNRLSTLLSLYEVWIEALRTRPRSKKGLGRPLFVLGLDVVVLVGLAIGGRMVYPLLTGWLTRWGLGAGVARIIFVALQLLVWVPVLVSVARAAKVLARRLGEQLLPSRAGAPDLAAAPRRALTIGLQIAVVIGVSMPLAMLTAPLALGPWAGLVPLVLLLVLLPILWRDASNLGGHLRASAEVVLAALRQDPTEPALVDVEAGKLDELLPGLGHVEVIELGGGSRGCARTLGELDIHAQTGAMVLALSREDGGRVRPGPEIVLQPGDRLVLLGAGDCLAQARVLLDRTPDAGVAELASKPTQPDGVHAELRDPM